VKLVRIRLRDYRGVADRQIDFASNGVTVIEGPNETGKSSIAEAIDLLLEELDSTAKQGVKDVKPVDRDAGPEVELEVETGDYAFRYRKRFLRDRLTELEISRPRHENLTGREAHERVQRILAETVDQALWKALRITQGSAIHQAQVHGTSSLAGALDRAAGTVPAGREEISLFERAREEYLAYWTETGRPKAEAAGLAQRLQSEQEALADVEADLQRLEDDVARMARLQSDLRDLGGARADADRRVADLRVRWKEIEGIQAVVGAIEAGAKNAQVAAERALEAEAGRIKAVSAVTDAIAERDRQVAALAESTPGLEVARERSQTASRILTEARAARDGAETIARLLRADVEYRRAEADLTGISDQKRRVDVARQALARAEAALVANRVDEATLSAIRGADLAVQMARARLDAGRPSVVLEALRSVEVAIDGDPVTLVPGEPVRRSVADRLRLTVPGTIEMGVEAGAGDARLAEALVAAQTVVKDVSARAGVVDLPAADAAAIARREAVTAKRENEEAIAKLLGTDGLGALAALEGRIAAAEQRTVGYLEARPTEPLVALDADTARDVADQAEKALDTVRGVAARTEVEEKAARERLAAFETRATEATVLLRVTEDAVTALERSLAEARGTVSDAALAAGRVDAVVAAERAVLEASEARTALERESPERVKTLLENAENVLAGASLALRQAEDERLQVETRLRDHGEDGLAEKRDTAITLRDAAARELGAYRTRAEARKLLFEALRRARQSAHLAYIGPLQEKIQALGQVVFGESLRIDMTEDLQIASRTLDRKTIPFTSLSVGAREQLGVITRLACAMIVAPDGGVPLILDDALGYSDPDRLEGMGAVLSLAGRSCQVIVLTCYPERYRHVGGATIQRIG
jgi:hypothetical protein